MRNLSDSRVLIVDDVKANVDVLVQALRDDYKLSVALDGHAALRIVERTPPDLVLLDIVMPGLDGYEVCRRLRGSAATRDVPVMFLSSLEDATDKARGFEAGANDYLAKPFEMLEAKARVRSLLKAKAYADAVREAGERELRIAREIQIGLLRADIAATTAGTGLDVDARLEPARHVGGDFYEVIRLKDGRLLVAVGDVSGKGVPAALFMAVTMTLLRATSRLSTDPADILRRVNAELLDQNPRSMFVTMQCMVLDASRRRVTFANAGHHPALLLSSHQPPREVCESSGPIVGILPADDIRSESLDLSPGDTIVLFTDGVTEAYDTQQDLLGDARLSRALAPLRVDRASDVTARVFDEVGRHAAGAQQSDDITVLAVHCTT